VPTRSPVASIDLAGRLSVRYQKDGREEALHGSFTWVQRPEATVVSLLSPLGQTLAVIMITPTQAAIEQSGQPTRTATAPDALAADVLGWPLPISGLRDWLQGFAIDTQGRRNAVAFNDTTTFKTGDGWTLQYAVWDNSDASHPHPKRIDMTRNTTEAGEVALRLVIDSWQPQAMPAQ
jgi:outer membrane lipoprotein LolB